MKKLLKLSLLTVVIAVLALISFSACNAETELNKELLLNGNFEEWTEIPGDSTSGKFESWTKGTFGDAENYKVQRASHLENDKKKPADAGKYSLIITNDKATASYMSQSVKVDKNATYHIKYFVKLPSPIKVGIDDYAAGPHLTFLESTGNIIKEVSTVGDWIEVDAYVTPRNTDYLTLCLAIGSQGRAASGTVYFDSVSMKRVDSVPNGVEIVEIFRDKVARYNINVSGTLFTVFLSLFSIVVAAVAYVIIRKSYCDKNTYLNFDEQILTNGKASTVKKVLTHPFSIAVYLVLLTAGIRMIFLFTMFGFGGETSTMIALSRKVFSTGITEAYANLSGANALTSPGSLYILYILGAMNKNLNTFDASILLRLVSVIADIAVVLTIYFYGKHYVGNKLSTTYAALFALLPVTFVLSALRGTFDALTVALVLIGIICMIEKKFIPMFILTVLAVVLDIRVMAVVPLILFYLGYCYYRADSTMKSFGKLRATIVIGFIVSLGAFYALTVPVALKFINNGEPFFILAKYKSMVSANTSFVNNAFNLYGMVGMNKKSVNSTAAVFNLIFILVLIVYVISLYVKNKNKLELLLLSSFTFAVIAVFTLKVSETYLFLSLALMLIYIMIAGEKRTYIVFSSYAVLCFLAMAQLMNQSGFVVPFTTSVLIDYESTAAFYIVFSVITVLVTLYFGYVTYSICNNSKTVDILPMKKPFITTIKDWTVKNLAKFKR